MGNSRQDVQRLFGHFGLDPSEYVVSFSHSTGGLAASSPSALAPRADTAPRASGEAELLDYQNFDLNR